MTKEERNKMAMFLTVIVWLKGKLQDLNYLPNFKSTFESFMGITDEIKELDSHKVAGTKGLKKDKDRAENDLITVALQTVAMLKAYATFAGNKLLLNSIDYTKSQLAYVSDQVLQSRAAHITQAAKDCGNKAEKYGLNADHMSKLETVADAFSDRVSNPRQAVISKKDIGDQLEAKIDEADNLLKEKMDVLMDLAGITKPELLNQYTAARVIVDR